VDEDAADPSESRGSADPRKLGLGVLAVELDRL
jgi:hypothetical protein